MKRKMINKKDQKLKLDDIITLNIGAIAHGGHFIARHNSQVIFVRHAITDEEIGRASCRERV